VSAVEEQYVQPLDTIADYYLADHLGSARMELASGGWPVWSEDFAPYGQEIAPQTTANNYKFTGYERDSESGNDYASARFYASSVGRFMNPDPSGLASADPSNPQSLNLYSYALNNPLSLVDPSGLDPHCTGYTVTESSASSDSGEPTDSGSCTAAGGSWGDFASGQTPSTSSSLNVQDNSAFFDQAWGMMGYGGGIASSGDSYSGPAAPSNGPKTPSICGGTFSFAGVEADGAVGGGFSGAIHEHDSIDGNSNGSLVEAFGGGEGAAVGGGKITSSGDKSIFQGFIGFVGASISAGPLAGLQVGYVGGKGFSGLYVEGHLGPVAYGTGGYLRSSCKKGG
jgi:RHS repeat-associated protein